MTLIPHRARRGFSLAEMMAVLAIVGIFATLLISGLGAGCVTTSARETSAETNAKAFAAKMSWAVKGVACSGMDSDQDGYASCTVSLEDGKSQAILCGYNRAFAPLGQNTSCKLATPITIQQAPQ